MADVATRASVEAWPLAWVYATTASTLATAATGAARQPRVGGAILEVEVPPLEGFVTDATIIGSSLVNNGGIVNPPLWSDANTMHNIGRNTKALKLHILKQSSNTRRPFLGFGTKPITMAFVLKKFPSSLKALPLRLPHSIAPLSEALFLKTAKGKKVLSVQLGRGDMEVDALLKNAVAMTRAVRKKLDTNLVREVVVEADRLTLPFWNRRLFDKGKHKVSMKSSKGRTDLEKKPMAPPVGPPLKRVRIT